MGVGRLSKGVMGKCDQWMSLKVEKGINELGVLSDSPAKAAIGMGQFVRFSTCDIRMNNIKDTHKSFTRARITICFVHKVTSSRCKQASSVKTQF